MQEKYKNIDTVQNRGEWVQVPLEQKWCKVMSLFINFFFAINMQQSNITKNKQKVAYPTFSQVKDWKMQKCFVKALTKSLNSKVIKPLLNKVIITLNSTLLKALKQLNRKLT